MSTIRANEQSAITGSEPPTRIFRIPPAVHPAWHSNCTWSEYQDPPRFPMSRPWRWSFSERGAFESSRNRPWNSPEAFSMIGEESRRGRSARLLKREQRSLRVLVVDDYPDNAESMAAVLRLNGHEAFAASGGHSALVMARMTQ